MAGFLAVRLNPNRQTYWKIALFVTESVNAFAQRPPESRPEREELKEMDTPPRALR